MNHSEEKVYGLPKYVYNADKQMDVLSEQYKRFEIIKTAVLFGYLPQKVGDKLVLMYGANGQTPTQAFLDTTKYNDSRYVIDMTKAKQNHNQFMIELGCTDQAALFDNINNVIGANQIYNSDFDAAYMAGFALQEVTKKDKNMGKEYYSFINSNMIDTMDLLEELSWGKNISKALNAYWQENDHKFNPDLDADMHREM